MERLELLKAKLGNVKNSKEGIRTRAGKQKIILSSSVFVCVVI